jgi:adenine-specific DNA-methyltransferase
MEKMRMESEDIQQDNVAKIAGLFPNCVTEARDENGHLKKAINFDLLRQMLSDAVTEGDEAYEFTWVGKKASIVEANRPIRKTLRPCKEDSVHWDTTENLYIEGDNLEVLKLLQESYLNKVDLIFIDPPYNTGKDFIYPDSFVMDDDEYNEGTGYFDEEGNVNYQRENSASAGRYHSDWCSMMYSRLELARNLLTDEGAIFISIDDNEYANLRKICDETFGSENYLTTFHIQVRYGDKSLNEEKIFKPMIEYVVAYAKNQKTYLPNQPTEEYGLEKFVFSIEEVAPGEIFTVNDQKVEVFKPGQWKIQKADKGTLDMLKETWISGSIYTNMSYGQVFQKVVEPRISIDGLGCLYKVYGRGDDGLGFRYYTGPAREGSIRGKMYSGVPLERAEAIKAGHASIRKKPIQCFYDFSADFGNIRHEGGVTFNSGKKPVKMMKQFINYCPKKDALVMDFFSGSASTAEGVLRLNEEDNGTRKFIMVQVPEITGKKSDAYKAGFSTICELGKQRIRNVIKDLNDDSLGFRVLKLDDSNMNNVYYAAGDYTQDMLTMMESNVKSDRTDLDLLFGCLLEWGLPLSLPYTSETIEGCTVHTYNDGDLIACFDENVPESVIKTIAKRQPLRAVFRDSSFASSPEKINVGEIFKLLAPDTRVKVI